MAKVKVLTRGQVLAIQKIEYKEPLSLMEMFLFENHMSPKTDIFVHEFYPYGYTGQFKDTDGDDYVVVLPKNNDNWIIEKGDYDKMSYDEIVRLLTGLFC